MNDEERRVLRELRHDYTPVAENIWQPLELHAEGLQPDAERDLQAALDDAERSKGPSPLGLVLKGQKGAGKTHLLHWFREQVHARRGYFFVVGLLDAKDFWTNVVLAVVNGLRRPWGGERTQAQVLLYLLGEELGASRDLQGVLIGSRAVSPEALDELERLLMRRDRLMAQTARATARALVLLASPDFEHQEIAETYFQSEEDELDSRRGWGLPRKPRSPEELLRDLTMLMSLTGPVVIAVDQIDTLISQSVRSLRDGEDDQAAQYLLLEQIGGGLMSLRERTRRTLMVVACLPSTWLRIKEQATDTIADRFRETNQLRTIPEAGMARALVTARFARHFADVDFTPPFATWPVADEAFESAVHYTPRRLLIEIDRHLRSCEISEEITLLERFGGDDGTGGGGGAGGGGGGARVVPVTDPPPPHDLDQLDARYAELRSSADPTPLGQGANEDGHWPGILLAGLWAWVVERGNRREEFSVDPLPGQMPPIHARLRQILDEETEDQVYWSFRAISADHHHRAALSRLKKACTTAALSDRIEGRFLVVLRDGNWSSGPKTQEAVAAFKAAGGREVPPSNDDLRSLIALATLREENPKHLDEWLELRQIATSLKIFADLPAGDEPTTEHGEPTAEHGESSAEHGEPAIGDGESSAATVALSDDVAVGKAFDDDELVSVRLQELRKHVAIFAGSGSGKTVLIRRLVEECALRGVSAIVLDPNNDLARLGDPWPERPPAWTGENAARAERYLAGTEVVVWTPGRESGRPLTFQPLPDFSAVRDDPDELGDAVAVAVSALEPRVRLDGKSDKVELRRAVLRQAVEHLGRSGGGSVHDLARLLGDLPYGVSDLAEAKKIGASLGQLLTAAMVNDPLFGGAGTAMDPGLLLTPTAGKQARISVISFVGLPGDAERQAFVNQLQMALFAWIRRHPAGDRPLGGLLVMDEAQNFAPSGGSTASTKSTLALASQARKYGLGLVFATQAPKGLHNRIPGNASTQFFGKLNAPAQVAAAKAMATAKGGDVSDVSRLGVGQFYASFESGGFVKLRTLLCLSHHPSSPLTPEEVVARAVPGPT